MDTGFYPASGSLDEILPYMLLLIVGIIRFMPLVVSHSSVLPLIPKIHRFCPSHFAPLMLLPFDRLTVSFKTS